MKKKKILWVVYCFVQAGGERYVYEICKALNKEKFQVDILHVNPLGSEKAWKTEFYYQPSIDAGCTVFGLEELLEKNKVPENPFVIRVLNFMQRKLGKKIERPIPQSDFIEIFLEDYDYVNFSGTSVYKTFCVDRNIDPKNGVVHILTAQFQQGKNLYEGYNKDFHYRFVSSISEKSQEQDLKGFKNYQLNYFPLCFETKPYFLSHNKSPEESFKIAVFTRLSLMKPLGPYFYALKLLLEQGVHVELEIYGAGHPEKLGLIRQLNYLYLRDHVIFKGHTESIESTLQQNRYEVIWFQSNNNVPAGYAALEIAMSGIPQIFWDFSSSELQPDLQDIFPSFTSLTEFVNCTKKLFDSPELRKELGEQQRKYVMENNSIEANIHILEKIFEQ